MPDQRAILHALHTELDASKRLGRSNIADIEAEIERVSAIVEDLPEEVRANGARLENSLATEAERGERYLASLRREIAKVTDPARRADIQSEIDRVTGGEPVDTARTSRVERAVPGPRSRRLTAAPSSPKQQSRAPRRPKP